MTIHGLLECQTLRTSSGRFRVRRDHELARSGPSLSRQPDRGSRRGAKIIAPFNGAPPPRLEESLKGSITVAQAPPLRLSPLGASDDASMIRFRHDRNWEPGRSAALRSRSKKTLLLGAQQPVSSGPESTRRTRRHRRQQSYFGGADGGLTILAGNRRVNADGSFVS